MGHREGRVLYPRKAVVTLVPCSMAPRKIFLRTSLYNSTLIENRLQ